VDDGHQLVERDPIAAPPGEQQLGHVWNRSVGRGWTWCHRSEGSLHPSFQRLLHAIFVFLTLPFKLAVHAFMGWRCARGQAGPVTVPDHDSRLHECVPVRRNGKGKMGGTQ
jgi:hypothetical protein